MSGGWRRSNVYYDLFPLENWNPFEETTSAFMDTRLDWKKTPDAHVFKADLPGMKEEEVKIDVKERIILEMSGERRKEEEGKNEKWHNVERRSGKFLRRFRLPEDVKVEEIKTSIKDGVLTVIVPKMEDKQPEIKSVPISG